MASDTPFSPGRRSFLSLSSSEGKDTVRLRPPWTDEAAIAAACTGCSDCIGVCPENILRADPRGAPMVEFDGGECTFCGKCAEACQEDVFDTTRTPPWPFKANLGDGCLQELGISCQLCRDVCPASAISVDLSQRPVGRLLIDSEACTGCGTCLGTCPEEALVFSDMSHGAGKA